MFDKEQAKAKIVADFWAEFPKLPTGPTGPKTQAGKQRIHLNAYKHGLTGQIHLFTAEEHEAFDKHCQAVVKALAPVGILEQDLAHAIAENRWRQKRARAIESGIFALGQLGELGEPSYPPRHNATQLQIDEALLQAKTWLAEGRNIQLLSLYEQRIQRLIEKNMAELRTLRAERLAARQQALEEAQLLAQLAQSKGEIYDPAADLPAPEFVFSSAEIQQRIARNQCLNEARALPKTRVNPNPGLQMPAAA
jgi:hypothetical protein